MCIGLPVQVLDGDAHVARCTGTAGELLVDMRLVGRQPPGTWLLSFLGAAREVISAERAAAVAAALAALAAARDGADDFSAFFADLEREPQLPDFLKMEPR